jgi:hypothetical protein
MTETKKPKSVFVATPMYGGMCTGAYTAAIMQLPMALAQAGILMYYTYMVNESLITRARNRCVDDFLRSDATHLMFIDADIGFDPSYVGKLMEYDKDIICGLYPKKEINWPRVAEAVKKDVEPKDLAKYTGTLVVNLIKNETVEVKVGELLEIKNGGTGFMLIKREVFENLADKVPEYVNDMFLVTEETDNPNKIKEFFDTSIDEESGRLFSEDYHFCKLARKHGYKIYADPAMHLTHTGTYVFIGQQAGGL